MPMNTVRDGDTLATTAWKLEAQPIGSPPTKAPLIVPPLKDGPEWVLLSTASVCDLQGGIHFFWFWRALRPGEEGTD